MKIAKSRGGGARATVTGRSITFGLRGFTKSSKVALPKNRKCRKCQKNAEIENKPMSNVTEIRDLVAVRNASIFRHIFKTKKSMKSQNSNSRVTGLNHFLKIKLLNSIYTVMGVSFFNNFISQTSEWFFLQNLDFWTNKSN